LPRAVPMPGDFAPKSAPPQSKRDVCANAFASRKERSDVGQHVQGPWLLFDDTNDKDRAEDLVVQDGICCPSHSDPRILPHSLCTRGRPGPGTEGIPHHPVPTAVLASP
jgi:hypothetical protein